MDSMIGVRQRNCVGQCLHITFEEDTNHWQSLENECTEKSKCTHKISKKKLKCDSRISKEKVSYEIVVYDCTKQGLDDIKLSTSDMTTKLTASSGGESTTYYHTADDMSDITTKYTASSGRGSTTSYHTPGNIKSSTSQVRTEETDGPRVENSTYYNMAVDKFPTTTIIAVCVALVVLLPGGAIGVVIFVVKRRHRKQPTGTRRTDQTAMSIQGNHYTSPHSSMQYEQIEPDVGLAQKPLNYTHTNITGSGRPSQIGADINGGPIEKHEVITDWSNNYFEGESNLNKFAIAGETDDHLMKDNDLYSDDDRDRGKQWNKASKHDANHDSTDYSPQMDAGMRPIEKFEATTDLSSNNFEDQTNLNKFAFAGETDDHLMKDNDLYSDDDGGLEKQRHQVSKQDASYDSTNHHVQENDYTEAEAYTPSRFLQSAKSQNIGNTDAEQDGFEMKDNEIYQ